MMTPLKLRTLSCHLRPEAQKLSAVEFVALNSQYCPVYFLNGSISTACMLPFGIDSSIRNEVSFVKHLRATPKDLQPESKAFLYFVNLRGFRCWLGTNHQSAVFFMFVPIQRHLVAPESVSVGVTGMTQAVSQDCPVTVPASMWCLASKLTTQS